MALWLKDYRVALGIYFSGLAIYEILVIASIVSKRTKCE